ncbi:MAG TPA: TetR family transcriptional regulator [Solirubrobacterales bacterium]|nr:TetR family transcriptional regulator [Solirubrobacterales bacterium]
MVGEQGVEHLTVRALSRTAGVSTRTFYEHFANIDDCCGSACESLMMMTLRRSARRRDAFTDAREGLRAAVRTATEDIAASPRAARFALLEVFGSGTSGFNRAERAATLLEQFLASSFRKLPGRPGLPCALVAGIAAGTLRVARQTTAEGRSDELPEFGADLAEWILSIADGRADGLIGRTRHSSLRGNSESLLDATRFDRGIASSEESRITAAVVRLAAAHGYTGLTAPLIRTEAGVSRQGFDARFADVEACYLATIESVLLRVAARANIGETDRLTWDRCIDEEILTLCAQLAADTAMARIVLVDILAPGRAGLICRERLISAAAEHLRSTVGRQATLNPVHAEASVAAAWRIAEAEVRRGRASRLVTLAPLIGYLALAPCTVRRRTSATMVPGPLK